MRISAVDGPHQETEIDRPHYTISQKTQIHRSVKLPLRLASLYAYRVSELPIATLFVQIRNKCRERTAKMRLRQRMDGTSEHIQHIIHRVFRGKRNFNLRLTKLQYTMLD